MQFKNNLDFTCNVSESILLGWTILPARCKFEANNFNVETPVLTSRAFDAILLHERAKKTQLTSLSIFNSCTYSKTCTAQIILVNLGNSHYEISHIVNKVHTFTPSKITSCNENFWHDSAEKNIWKVSEPKFLEGTIIFPRIPLPLIQSLTEITLATFILTMNCFSERSLGDEG